MQDPAWGAGSGRGLRARHLLSPLEIPGSGGLWLPGTWRDSLSSIFPSETFQGSVLAVLHRTSSKSALIP